MSNTEKNTEISHNYVEVAAELLAKPAALCDIVEAQGGKSTLVYCNNPSDADFVEVILKKRGISALKLIGFVAPEKLEKTQESVKNGEIHALVVTDVAGRGLNISMFEVVINYSLPSDLDNYALRIAADQPGKRNVFSVVNPLDFANLHQLKTLTGFDFVKAEAPGKEDLARAKLIKLKTVAAAKYETLNPTLTELARQVLADKDSAQIIALLLNNSLETVPQLQAQVEKLIWEKENADEQDDYSQGQPRSGSGRDRDFGNRDGRDRDNRDRDSRDRGDSRSRNSRGRDRDNRRGSDNSRSRSSYDDDSNNEYQAGSDDSSDNDNSRDDNSRGNSRREERRPPPAFKIRDDRLYIGKGEKDGFSKEEFAELLKEKCGLEGEQLKRFLLRKNYSFADLAEGVSADVISKLDGADSKSGSLYVAKATQVITIVENQDQGEPAAESENSESDQGQTEEQITSA